MLRSFFKIFSGLLLISLAIVGLTAINHPIILKWATGSARIIGKPITVAIYTNGQITNDVKAYKVRTYWGGKKANYYLLHFLYADTKKTKEIISINLQDNYIGRPTGANKEDYDIVFGQMFQSEVGAHFSTFQNDMKGYNFDPKLSSITSQIKFNIPPTAGQFKCDSIRVEL